MTCREPEWCLTTTMSSLPLLWAIWFAMEGYLGYYSFTGSWVKSLLVAGVCFVIGYVYGSSKVRKGRDDDEDGT